MAQLEQQEDALKLAREDFERGLNRVKEAQERNQAMHERKKRAHSAVNAPVLERNLRKAMEHQKSLRQHQKEQQQFGQPHQHHQHQSIASKPPKNNKQKEIISVDDEIVEEVHPILNEKRIAPNPVAELEREIRLESAAAAGRGGGGDGGGGGTDEDNKGGDDEEEKDEEREQEMKFEKESSSVPSRRRQPSRKKLRKKSQKNIDHMIKGRTIQNQMKKLKKQTNEESPHQKDRRITYLTNERDEAQSELRKFQEDQIKKETTKKIEKTSS